MIRRITIAVLTTFCIAIQPAFAGTWRDDLEDGNLDGWKMYKLEWMGPAFMPNEGNWRVENGIVIGEDGNKAMAYGLYMGEASWTDYTAEVSVKLSKELKNCGTWTTVWLGVWGQELPYMNYFLGMQHYAGNNPIQMENGNTVAPPGEAAGGIICPKDPSAATHKLLKIFLETNTSDWYRLRVTVIGNLITCFIDEKQVSEFTDLRYPTGCVAFSTTGVVAMFDDFMVTGPEIPNGGPGFAVTPRNKLATMWGSIKGGR